MGLWSFLEDHQFKVSNHFLTWGWSESPQDNCLPLGNIKNFGKKVSYNKKGNALLIGMSGSRYSMHMYSSPVAGQWLEYFNEEVKFYNNLPKSIQVDLTVRLLSEDYGWCQKERWEDLFSGIKLDIGKIPLEKQVSNSRISISSYNATTYLETLSQNIPTMIFWNPKQWELRDSAIPSFDKLKSVGIFHEDPKAAALHLVNIWDDIESWWNTKELQTAREEFCQTYAYIPPKPFRHTVDVFNSLISEE